MEKISEIIRNHRVAKGLTQKELGDKLFISKQAVSKWETGKTLPDIETVRKLRDILEISNDEILGGSIEDAKKNRKWLKVCIAVSIFCILLALFFRFGGLDYIGRHTQSGVAYLSVFGNGALFPTSEYQITSELKFEDLKNGYAFDIGYGELRGTIHFSDQPDIVFGFVNTNNWHNIHIRLDITNSNGQLAVKQTISYKTDNNLYQVMVTEGIAAEDVISVFQDGI